MEDLEAKIVEVKKLVSDTWDVKLENLTGETRLLDDLGMDGDDGVEFIEIFAKNFQVDISGFESNLYFGEEAGANPITFLYYLLFKSKRHRFVPITITDLAKSAVGKK